MKQIEQITISSPDVGRCNSFIYCLYITDPEGVVYIGETGARNGILGRLSNHMTKGEGTFIRKCYEKKNINLDEINGNIHMIAFNLKEYPDLCGDVNRPNHRALEYFVQNKLEEYSVAESTIIPYDVVSWVRIAQRFALNENYIRIAEEVADAFYAKLPFTKNLFSGKACL